MAGFFTDRQDRVDELLRLVSEGYSFRRIAGIMGAPSRNVCLCKFGRMRKLDSTLHYPHSADSQRGGAERRKPAETTPRPPRPVPVKQEQVLVLATNLTPVVLEDGYFATLETLTTRMCNYPMGDPGDRDFHYCGHPKKTGSSYCDVHHALCRVPAQQRRVKIEHRGAKRA